MDLVSLANGKQVFIRRVTIGQDFRALALEAKDNNAQGAPVDALLLYAKQ
jgi:hypothetical protein